MTLQDALRQRLSQLVSVAATLDAGVVGLDAGELPVVQLARLLLTVDGACCDLHQYAEDLHRLQGKRT
jgi:hypothetical protein